MKEMRRSCHQLPTQLLRSQKQLNASLQKTESENLRVFAEHQKMYQLYAHQERVRKESPEYMRRYQNMSCKGSQESRAANMQMQMSPSENRRLQMSIVAKTRYLKKISNE